MGRAIWSSGRKQWLRVDMGGWRQEAVEVDTGRRHFPIFKELCLQLVIQVGLDFLPLRKAIPVLFWN